MTYQIALPRPPAFMTTGARLRELMLDLYVLFLLVVPIGGTFYTFETYFAVRGLGYDDSQVDQTHLTATLLVFMTLSLVPLYVRARRNGRVYHPWLLYLYVGWVFCSLGWASNPPWSFLRAIRLLPPLGVGLLLPSLYGRDKLFRMMMIAFLVAACASIIMGVFIPYYGLDKLGASLHAAAWRGATLQKNGLGEQSSLAMIFSFFGFMYQKADRRLACFTFACAGIALLGSQSMTSLLWTVAGMVMLLGIGLLQRAPRGLRLLLPVCLIGLLVLIVSAATISPDLLFAAIGRDMTFTGRTQIWSAVLTKIHQRPWIGYGYAFWGQDTPDRAALWKDVGFHPLTAHNSWLDLTLQLGMVGCLVFGAFFFMTYARIFFRVIQGSRVAALLLVLITIFLGVSLVEAEFTEPAGGSAFFWLAWMSSMASAKETRPGLRSS